MRIYYNILLSEYKFFLFDPVTISLLFFSLCIIFIAIHLEFQIRKKNNFLFYIEEFANTITSYKDNVIVVYDINESKYEYISSNFEKTFEINKDEFAQKGKKLKDFLPSELADKFQNLYTSDRQDKIIELDFEYIKPISKKRCWLMVKAYPIYKHSILKRYMCIATDISKEKQIQLELSEALVELQNVNEAKKKFVSHMSHELKTPISTIIGLATVAKNSLEDVEKTGRYLTMINDVSRNLLAIINNILDLSKIDSKVLVINNEKFNLRLIINEFIILMKEQAEINNQTITYQIDDNIEEVLIGDSLRLTQILTNCISNSFKFTPAGGEIHLSMNAFDKVDKKAYYRFTITDNGKGMSEDYLEHIFNPFEQEDNSISKKFGGTGLGLTITRELVHLMGGEIRIKSKEGTGTTVTIQIGFSIGDFENNTTNTYSVKQEDNVGKIKRLLLVEDNEINREITSEMLQNQNLFVDTALDGYEAIKLFCASEKGYYDIILMDLHMPGIDGYETAALIRESEHPDAKTINIISLSADDYSNNYESNNSCINFNINKPIDINSFLSQIS